MTNKDDDRYPTDEDDDDERFRRTSEDSAFSFEHVEICPLEAQCNPQLDGKFDKAAVLARIADLSPADLSNLAELCLCVKGCKYRKCLDSDAAWWPHCAAAWYEPGMVRRSPFSPVLRILPVRRASLPPRRQPRARGFCQKIT